MAESIESHPIRDLPVCKIARGDGLNGIETMKKVDYRKLCHPAHPEFRLAKRRFHLMALAGFDHHEDGCPVVENYGVDGRRIHRASSTRRTAEHAKI